MSRIAKIPVTIPEGVQVNLENRKVTVTGPKGTLFIHLGGQVKVVIDGNMVKVELGSEEEKNLPGLTRTLIANMVQGVTSGWGKVLELNGTGYRATTNGSDLNLALGFSHPVVIKAPTGIAFEVKENKITVRGADKSLVGEVAAKIRALRPADPYKLKGFKYEGEIIIKKAGKAAKAGGGK